MKKTNFPKVNQKQSFPKLEEEILKFWQEEKIFEESISSRENCDEFAFYDGPPFATGTPHYGHILAGTIKDVITRYQTMIGKQVYRVNGWDCHGLPIENIVEKKLNISGKDDIEKIGIHAFNEACRDNVFGYVDDWKNTIQRMGRFIDMDNSWKTMDLSFMQSVWSVFKKIYDKGLIYEGHRVVPYCPRCTTPLSNFEVNQGYKDKQSKAVTVKYKIKGNDSKYLLVWTTTPWSLVSNVGIAVGEDIDYTELFDNKNKETYILAKARVGDYYKNSDEYLIIGEYKGKCLKGLKYEHIYDDFVSQLENGIDLGTSIEFGKNVFSVVFGHHVTTDSGTGIVHMAPAYGEDDNIIAKENDLGFVYHINDSGKTCNLLKNNGMLVFDYNDKVIQELKEKNVLVKLGTITHSYPHCWRCETPLIYRAISAWYVAVEDIKDRMLKNNDKINWTPEIIKHGRFGKWIEGARDWNISRNRYWGSAIPVWQSEDKKEEVCIGSIEELYNLNKDFGDITKVIIVRHGRTDYNEKGFMDYKGNANLTEIGKKQAINLKDRLKDLDIDVIYSSPLSRCKDTISPLAKEKGLDINIVDDFIEINSPDLQDQKFDCKNYKWENGYGGGETIKQVYERVERGFKKIIDENKGKTVVICSHGDPTFLMRKLMLGLDYDTQKYTSGYYLENNPEKYSLDKLYVLDYVYTKNYKQIDLHKHFVDDLLVKNPETKNTLKRIPEVLDCWFESGAMPYASKGLVFEDKKKEKTTKVILVRHGRTNLNDQNLQDDLGLAELTELGKKQAENIKELLKNEKVDLIYSSPLSRCINTIAPLANKLNKEIIIEDNFREANIGSLRGKEVNFDFFRENKNEIIGGGETYNELYERMVKTYKKVIRENKGKTIVICSHGDPLYTILSYIIGFEIKGETDKNIFLSNKNEDAKTMFSIQEVCSETGKKINLSIPSPFGRGVGGGLENFRFPADFIAEGLDQTRGWFYTLLILGTALFDNTPFLNVIVNGIVLAEDGRKMSKSLKNYPDPQHIFDKYGADAMRFYLMNSSVVEAQDLRFAEAGVEEVVKKVILPLWNTYSFFTTYANIDGFEPKKGNLYFIRHAESESNAKWAKLGGSISGGNDNPKLTKKGIEQSILAGKKIRLSGEKIDLIIASDLERTINTAELIAKEIGYNGKIIQNPNLREQNYADFEGKPHSELAQKYGVDINDHVALRKIFKNSSVENYHQFDKRVTNEIEKILKEYEGKNILLVGHAGTSRPIIRKYLGLDMDYAHLEKPTPKNARLIKLPSFPLTNNLDKWILSELHKLIHDFSAGLDNYKLNEATKHVVKFMDNLTNWYIRRSRKRFWKSENDMDKIEAYNTLYEVLIEITKIISPFMPFVSESIYKNLTGKKSVHLDIFPESISSFIQKNLSEDMDKTQKIINLGLAWRANHKIRVRQPLHSVTIGEKLDDYYNEIIKEELNVKEIITIDSSKIAKKVCKPNARLIGPKFGGDVKFIISEAKAGNFEELKNGDVKVGNFTLESNEFEIAFEVGDSGFDIEVGFGMVIAMDSNITKELKLEGYARDIVRQIQESRKEANYNVDDRIVTNISSENEEINELIKNFSTYIETETLSKLDLNLTNGDIEKEVDLENFVVKIILKK